MKHKFFYSLLLIFLVCFTNDVSAQFVPFQSGQFKRLAADTLYDFTGCDTPTVTPNSYRRVVRYYDSCNHVNWHWQPELQEWAVSSGSGTDIRDTAKLVQGPFIYINNADSTYKPNGLDVQIAVDTAGLGDWIINTVIAGDTTISQVVNNADFIVKYHSGSPVADVNGDKYLVSDPASGAFTGQENNVAEKVGGVYTFTIPSTGDNLIVNNSATSTFETYQFNGFTWILQNVVILAGGNRGIGDVPIGTKDSTSLIIKTFDTAAIVIDPLRNIFLPKFLNALPNNYLKIDSATGRIDTGHHSVLAPGTNVTFTNSNDTTYINSGGGGSTVFANEGLTKDVDTVKLGGTLTTARTISAGTFNLTLSGNKSTSGGLLTVTNANTTTVASAISTTGTISATRNSSTATAYAMSASNTQGTGLNVTGTSVTLPSAIINNATSGSGQYIGLKIVNTNSSSANGNGIYQNFELYNSGAAARTSNRFLSRWDDNLVETSEFVISGIGAAIQTDLFSLMGTGAAKLNQYGSGTFTGTAAYGLSVDASGNIIETTPGGGGSGSGLNIYNSDSLLASDRVVGLNGKTLEFSGAVTLLLNPVAGSERISANTSDGTGNSNLYIRSNTDDGYGFSVDASNAINGISIVGDAAANSIVHTAATHNFNGTVTVPNGTPANGLTFTASTNSGFVQSAELDNVNGFRMKYGNTDLGGGMRRNIGNNTGELRIFSDSTVNNAYMTFYTKGSRAMLIDSNRYVLVDNRLGIGNTAPRAVLEVGPTNMSPILSNPLYQGIVGTSTTSRVKLELLDQNGNEIAVFTDGTRAYIGTMSNTAIHWTFNNSDAGILTSSNSWTLGNGNQPNAKVDIQGSLALKYTATATGITLDLNNNSVDVTATGQTITLPTAVGITGRTYIIKLTASGSATVATTSSQTIDGSTTYSLSAQYKYVTVQSNGANWNIIGNN